MRYRKYPRGGYRKRASQKQMIVTVIALLVLTIVGTVQHDKGLHLPGGEERGSISTADITSEKQESRETNDDAFLSVNAARGEINGPYRVVRVVDGDTYKISIDGKEETVRLIGVDTPESVAQGERASDNCREGKEASKYMKRLITGEDVYLEYDVAQTDKYGRVLAYVYYDGVQIEKMLLEKGYARAMTVAPNVNYASDYASLQREAREEERGFWASDPWGKE